jgi:hypothetical protein
MMGLCACATTPATPSLEIPLRQALKDACETLPIPAESELPPLSQDQAAAAQQLKERDYWMRRDLSHEGVEHRLCRQRDEAVALIGQANQVSRGTH